MHRSRTGRSAPIVGHGGRLTVLMAVVVAVLSGYGIASAGSQAVAAAAAQVQADFNGDGLADLAIGVPNEDVGTAAGAGVVQVLYSNSVGLTGTGSQLFQQGAGGLGGTPEAGDGFGLVLSTGDFNGDGRTDLAIGVPFEDVGTVDTAGVVHVLYGGTSGLTGIGSQVLQQGAGGLSETPHAGDLFGEALAAGDFNGDGRADLAIGAPGEVRAGREHAGAVQVLRGTSTGLTGMPALYQQGNNGVGDFPEAGDLFGYKLAAADFNGDARADLAIGLYAEDVGDDPLQDSGQVHVLYGSPTGLVGTGSQVFRQGTGGLLGVPQPGDYFGRSLAAGDYNGDGRADLAVGVPFQFVGGSDGAGEVQVLYGGTGGLSGNGDQLFTQATDGVLGDPEADDGFGLALAAGDFDADGRADLAIGVPFEHIDGFQDAGVVQVLYGSASGVATPRNQLIRQGSNETPGTPEDFDYFGWALAAGRFNAGLEWDLAVSVIGDTVGSVDSAGSVYTFHGSSVALLTGPNTRVFNQATGGVAGTPETSDSFGWAVASSG